MPTVVYAAGNAAISDLIGSLARHILNPLIELMFAVALLVFLWGVYQYYIDTADPGRHEDGARHILFGIIGMFIMVSVYGIIYFVTNTIGIPPGDLPPGLR